MVLEKHVPDAVERDDVTDIYTEHLPNYCSECGGEIVVAGGRIAPDEGWYEHLDPVLTCGECGRQTRHTVGVDPDHGREWRSAPGADSEKNEELFGDYAAYCDIHGRDMVATKALRLDGRPMRQYKCPECDREAVITTSRLKGENNG